jgi:hypothetical protein
MPLNLALAQKYGPQEFAYSKSICGSFQEELM